jgi:hypothetical protein
MKSDSYSTETLSGGIGTPCQCGTLRKVNRCMAEGRKAFLERFAEIYGSAG